MYCQEDHDGVVVESVILLLCKGDDKSHSSKSSYSMIENSSKTPVNQMRAEHRGTNAKEATDELLGAAVGESGPARVPPSCPRQGYEYCPYLESNVVRGEVVAETCSNRTPPDHVDESSESSRQTIHLWP